LTVDIREGGLSEHFHLIHRGPDRTVPEFQIITSERESHNGSTDRRPVLLAGKYDESCL
jgi:hypothetical protein